MQMYLKEGEGLKIPINNLLPFANVDGIGNRCSIFVQGCNLKCIYCHNPETIPMVNKDASIREVDDIVNEIKIYKPYIRGITVSGGEPTIYHNSLVELFNKVHSLGLTCYIDTNGFYDKDKIKNLIDVTDKFLFDIKSLNKQKEICNTIKKNNLKNLIDLLELGKVEEVRTVCLKNGFSDVEYVVETVSNILKDYPDVLYKLIKVHTRGSCNEDLLKDKIPSNKEMNTYGKLASNLGVKKVKVIL